MEAAPGCTKTPAGEPGKTVPGVGPAGDARGGLSARRGGWGSVLFFISSFFTRSFFIRSFFIISFFICSFFIHYFFYTFIFYTVHFLYGSFFILFIFYNSKFIITNQY